MMEKLTNLRYYTIFGAGTMLTWETNSPPDLKDQHKYNERQGPVKLILDG